MQKHIRHRDLADYLEQIVRVLKAGYNDDQEVLALMHYMIQAGESTDPAELLKQLGSRISKHKEELMTMAETLRHQEKLEGRMEVARSMLARGMAIDQVMDLTGLGEEDLRQMAH